MFDPGNMSEKASVRVVIRGRVQGVFFRSFTVSRARELKITGYVRNMANGEVEVVAEGDRDRLEQLLGHLRKGPPAARVDAVEVAWSLYNGQHTRFVTAPSE